MICSRNGSLEVFDVLSGQSDALLYVQNNWRLSFLLDWMAQLLLAILVVVALLLFLLGLSYLMLSRYPLSFCSRDCIKIIQDNN